MGDDRSEFDFSQIIKRGSWAVVVVMVGLGQGLSRLGSKVNAVQTLLRVCTLKQIFMGRSAQVMH